MFKKLRNKLIIMNLGITSCVIVVVFSVIYITSVRLADNRPPMPPKFNSEMEEEVENTIELSIREEKRIAASELLTTLIISGISIELIVALVSYLVAEEAIKPVREAYESQKIFIANASHEIKTPLAAISANLEAADIKNNRWIKNVEAETAKLATLNSALLKLARSDLSRQVTEEETDVVKLVLDSVESFTPRLKKHTFQKKIIPALKTKINREDFTQILSILLDNAIKYSESKIILELDEHKLTITNDGATIPKEALPHIFDRFYQVDKSSSGVGLGLSIAKSLADNNHWQIKASSSNGKTRFELVF